MSPHTPIIDALLEKGRADARAARGAAGRAHPAFRDETGHRYGSLTVVGRAANVNGNARWHCRCDCGAELVVEGIRLRSGGKSRCDDCTGKAPPTCSYCHGQGHVSAGCPERPNTKHRARRCGHGFVKGLCTVASCAHFDGVRDAREALRTLVVEGSRGKRQPPRRKSA